MFLFSLVLSKFVSKLCTDLLRTCSWWQQKVEGCCLPQCVISAVKPIAYLSVLVKAYPVGWRVIISLYQAVLRPHLDYCAQFQASSTRKLLTIWRKSSRIWRMMYKEQLRKQGLPSLEERGFGQGNWAALFSYLMEFIEKMEPKIVEVHSYRTISSSHKLKQGFPIRV